MTRAVIILLLMSIAALLPGPRCACTEEDGPPADATEKHVGLGVEWKLDHASLLVMKVLPGGSAERAGLVVGDRVLAINGQPTGSMKPNELSTLLDGKEGNRLLLAVTSEGKETRALTVVRGVIPAARAMPDGVAAAAQAHRRMRVEREEQEERFVPVQSDIEALRVVIEREAHYMARVGGLTADETKQLAQAGEQAIGRRRVVFAVEGNRINRQLLIMRNGRRELRAVQSESPEQMVRRELTPALKELSYQAWDKYESERQRHEERRRQADLLVQVTALDDAVLLTDEQRDQWLQWLSAHWNGIWRGYPNGRTRPQLLQLCVNPSSAMGSFSVPLADLQTMLRTTQRETFDALQSPATLESAVRQPLPQAGAPMIGGARGLAAPNPPVGAAPQQEVVRERAPLLPLEEQRRRLESLLQRLVEDADVCAGLDEGQKQKLLLAGKLDLDRYLRQQAALEGTPSEREQVRAIANVPAAQVCLPPVLHGPESHFQKALRSRLSPSQCDKLSQAQLARALFRERAMLQSLAVALAERAALTDEQAQRVYDWLRARVCAAAQITSGSEWGSTALRLVSRLPPEELQPLVDDWQWPAAREYLSELAEIARDLQRPTATFPEEPAER
ncbi:MAG TPA: PDZ domain-containing protein [Pirellulales bacterium]|nr:PDZ domain-containing protein [Pirellulales bacterium]